jgi:subtilisin family serine protease
MKPGLHPLWAATFLAVVSTSAFVPIAESTGLADVVRLPRQSADRAESTGIRPAQGLDYGSFAWWVLDPGGAAQLADEGIEVQLIADPYTLDLGGERFDPLEGVPDPPAGWTRRDHGGPDLFLIQAVGPIRSGWLSELRRADIEPVQYIHPFTFVVWCRAAELDAFGSASWARWVGEFSPSFRVLPRFREPPPGALEADILVPAAADAGSVVPGLEAAGAVISSSASAGTRWTIVTTTIPSGRLPAAAAVPGVYSIQPIPEDGGARGEMSNQVCAGNTLPDNTALPGYQAWLGSIGLDGDGVVMANVDQGVDDGHPDLAGQLLPCTGVSCGGGALSSHGTHTAAIQAATGASGVTHLGFLRALGVAPGARLVEQLYSPFFTQPDGMLLLMGESHGNGAVLSNNSWGPAGTPRGYDNDTMQTDIGVRDVDASSPGNQPFHYVLSIMNGGGGTSSQGTPDEAKNLLTVGSTKMQNADGTQILDIDDLSANTAHGPALDGRHIPHIVAPGCRVDSAVPTGYGLSCGTSMSSPHVSGTAALLIEQWRSAFGSDPSPAMVKAEIIAAARDLAGHLDADGGVLGHPFDSKQGWGRLDSAATLAPATQKAVFDDPRLLTATGDEWIYTLSVDDESEPVKVMLVWTDAPGHGLGGSTPAWNNDLDLVVMAGGLEYPGNSFDGDGWSLPGVAADGANNTEGVFLPPGAADEVTIRVRASNLSSDGVPGNSSPTDQDFALVALNTIPGSCGRGTHFHGDLELDELVIDGAQGYRLDWLAATPNCGGEVGYVVHDSRLAEPGPPLLSTGETTATVVGMAPGGSHCFVVGSTEDGAPGQASGSQCLAGTGVRRAGDLDCDGDHSANDIALVVATIFGAAEPTCAGYPAGDCDLDGVIDARDLGQLVRSMDDSL